MYKLNPITGKLDLVNPASSPGGSDTQVQFNDGGSFGGDAGFTYNKTTYALTVNGLVHTPIVQAHNSAGLIIEATGGADVALFGAGGGQNATFYDGVKLDASTASRILSTDASKNITALDTTTYPSLTELSYVKGVTSAVQTQLGTKVTGPASAVDNDVVAFDGTTGKLVKDTGILYTDLVTTTSGDARYLKLDTTNDPLTGNLEISKATPEYSINDTTNNYNSRWYRDNADIYHKAEVVAAGSAFALDFDSTSDKLDLATPNALLTGTGNFTLTAWIKPSTVATGYIMGNYGTSNINGIEFYTSSIGNELKVYMGAAISSGVTLSASAWHFVAVKRSGTTVSFYVDGIEYSGGTSSHNITSSLNWTVGNGPNYTTERFRGTIDQVSVWNTALSTAQLDAIYNSAAGALITPTANTLLLWEMTEGSGSSVADTSGNGRTGAIVGASWVTGIVTSPGSVGEITYLQIEDGVLNSSNSRIVLGNNLSENLINGLSTKIQLSGVNKFEIDSSGNANFYNNNLLKSKTTSSSIGVITSGGNSFLHDFSHPTGSSAIPEGYNIILGRGAGNFTMGSTATSVSQGSYNIVMGRDSGTTITTGNHNVLIGRQVGDLITTAVGNTFVGNYAGSQTGASITGDANTAFGYFALAGIRGGFNNTAVGYQTADAITSGARNTAIGDNAFGDLTTSNFGVAIGYLAGKSTSASASVTSAEDSIFIGRDTRPNANTETNQIVIGTTAIGNGSNTITLGNTSITDLYIVGNTIVNAVSAINYGRSNTVAGANNVAFGRSVNVGTNNVSNVGIGVSVTSTGSASEGSVAVGISVGASAQRAMSFGISNTTTGFNNTGLFGYGLTANTSSQYVLGENFSAPAASGVYLGTNGTSYLAVRSGNNTAGLNTTTHNGTWHVQNPSGVTGTATESIQAIASQTANLTSWRNSSGTALLGVAVGGQILQTLNGATGLLGAANSSAEFANAVNGAQTIAITNTSTGTAAYNRLYIGQSNGVGGYGALIRYNGNYTGVSGAAGVLELDNYDNPIWITANPTNSRKQIVIDGTNGVVFNDDGLAAYDLRVEGDTDQYLFFVDSGVDKISIGSSTVNAKLDILSTTEQLRILYDASNYYSTTVGSGGGVTFDAVGSGAGFTFNDDITLADAKNLILNATMGTKIGTSTSQKLGFWNATPIVQPTTAVAAATFVANTSGIVDDTATFDGYTIGQVVKALRNAGLLA